MNICQSCGVKVSPIAKQLKKEKEKQIQIHKELNELNENHKRKVTQLNNKLSKSKLKVNILEDKSVNPQLKSSNSKLNIQIEINKHWKEIGDIQTVGNSYNKKHVDKLVAILKRNNEPKLADDIKGWFDCYAYEKNSTTKLDFYKKTQNMLAIKGFDIPCADTLQIYEQHNENTCLGYCFYSEMSDSEMPYSEMPYSEMPDSEMSDSEP